MLVELCTYTSGGFILVLYGWFILICTGGSCKIATNEVKKKKKFIMVIIHQIG